MTKSPRKSPRTPPVPAAAAVATAALLLAPMLQTPAQAQSTLTLSGFMDLGVHRDREKTWIMSPIQRSNLAFSGKEDLGGGLSVGFRLSTRYEPDSGQQEDAAVKPYFHDQATIGLQGGFGSVQLGRRLDAVYNNDWHFDPWDYNDRIASPAWDTWHYHYPSDPQGNNGTAEYGRLNNGVFYDSPQVGGEKTGKFSLHLSASPEKRPGDERRPVAGALVWQGSGGLRAMASRATNSAKNTDTLFGLRAPVPGLQNLVLMGAYNVSKAQASRAKTAQAGAQYTLGATTFKTGWSRLQVNGERAVTVLGLGASHALSKRSALYVSLGRKKFARDDNSHTVYGVGVSHAF